uniref:Uncharacterized protein n=1 Tax=Anguilla anguilla TaxID=7936 RepID=A0A0E9VI65_ANGAN
MLKKFALRQFKVNQGTTLKNYIQKMIFPMKSCPLTYFPSVLFQRTFLVTLTSLNHCNKITKTH